MSDTFVDSSPPVSWLPPTNLGPLTSTKAVSGSYSETKEDYIDRFHKLADQWRAQTLHSSFIEQKVQHFAFKQIVGMGTIAIPLILNEIMTNPDFLYFALQLITGENPVPKRDRASVRAAIDAWIMWAHRSGYNTA